MRSFSIKYLLFTLYSLPSSANFTLFSLISRSNNTNARINTGDRRMRRLKYIIQRTLAFTFTNFNSGITSRNNNNIQIEVLNSSDWTELGSHSYSHSHLFNGFMYVPKIK